MLINTVILFLRDALPLALIIAMLLSLTIKLQIHTRWLYTAILISFFTTISLISYIDVIAQLFDSRGLELMFSMIYGLIYILILMNLWSIHFKENKHYALYCAVAIFVLVATQNGADFLVYITGYWRQIGAVPSLFVGVALGIGICISIGILLYFITVLSDDNVYPASSSLLLLLFGAGQINHASNQLLQIDVLPESQFLWDTNFLLPENSEIGYFFSALFGYDATPTLFQALLYLGFLFIPMVVFRLYQGKFDLHNIQGNS